MQARSPALFPKPAPDGLGPYASDQLAVPRRRGVVLILVIGMLALMALIGVTFATFSGQSQRSSRNFAEKLLRPNPQDLVDYALSQLINDSDNPLSAIRGHSLKRDMYGNDGQYNGFIDRHPLTKQAPLITAAADGGAGTAIVITNLQNQAIATQGLNFNRWILKLFASTVNREVAQTFEVVDLDLNLSTLARPATGFVRLQLTPRQLIIDPSNPGVGTRTEYGAFLAPGITGSVNEFVNRPFVLDGRYLNAFNGPGVSTLSVTADGVNPALYTPDRNNASFTMRDAAGRHPNYLFNGLTTVNIAGVPTPVWYQRTAGTLGALGDPTLVGMDEDYDAPDLENWFLAIQSADGKVVVPSFHRPSIIYRDPTDTGNTNANTSDWRKDPAATINLGIKNGTLTAAQIQLAFQTRSKFLRPRKVDNPDWRWKENPNGQDPIPDANGRVEYDVDNDGDGYREGVWLDLGYPPQRDAQTGKLFKPLFSFTVIGLNGKLPLNTAGNLQARRRFTDYDGGTGQIRNAGDPTWTHTSHLGFSVSEINPLFALQNAYNPATGTNNNGGLDLDGNPTLLPLTPAVSGYYAQTDNAGVSVAVTQLRNLLTGTRTHRDIHAPNAAENQDYNVVQTGDITQPTYMPNNVLDAQDLGTARLTESVEGRWGEGDGIPRVLLNPTTAGLPYYMAFHHLSRAGRSVTPKPAQLPYFDGTDDNYTTRDPFPWYDPSNGISPESADLVNPAGTTAAIETGIAGERTIPSERMRYFTTPLDISGTGLVAAKDWNGPVRINNAGASPIALRPQIQFGTGPDRWGRVGHFFYFRPPGVAPASLGVPVNPQHGYDSHRLPAGITDPADQILHGPSGADYPHAFGAITVPTATPTTLSPMFLMAGMPYDPNAATPDVAPTFSLDASGTSAGLDTINSRSSPGVSGLAAIYGLNHGSLGKDEADEMNLYAPNSFDAAFNHNDLDWLYNTDKEIVRKSSRLAKLAPIAFTNAFDGVQRRKLMSIDTWDLNRFSFAPENPGGAFPFNNRNPGGISYSLNGGFRYAGSEAAPIKLNLQTSGLTPALAQSDRRIDLNAPLPASVNPLEPIRQKWVLHAYHAAVQILPPTAVDHPVERAQLSQFILNIVDFRDPDPICTVFRNPELVLLPADAGRPARVAFVDDTRNIPQLSTGAAADDRWSKRVPLEQYGMEHNPIAINEILAFAYQSKATGGTGTENGRLFIELINTLSRPAVLTNPNNGSTNASVNFSSLDLNGWDMVILGDADWTTRPDPINGAPANETVAATLNYSATATPPDEALNFRASGTGATPDFNDPVPSLNPYPNAFADNNVDASYNTVPSKHYYVLSNDAPTASNAEENTPPQGNTDRPTVVLPQSWVDNNLITNMTTGLTTSRQDKRYHWLYLRRPANPFSPVQPDPTAANYNPWVVMDSFRFAFIEGSGTVDTMNDTANNNGEDIYSLMRRQPYRGGQLVFDHQTVFDTDASGNPNPASPRPRNAYGYSEQPTVTNDTTPNGTQAYRGLWKAGNGSTKPIWHTIGQPNTIDNNNPADEWAHFPFFDRDFASVAELLMVPGSSPGLFTKQFVERGYKVADTGNPGNRAVSNDYRTTPPNHGGANNNQNETLDSPVTFPYLPDAFYYTASSPFGHLTNPYDATQEAKAPPSLIPTASYVAFLGGTPGPQHNPKIGGATGAGWHRLLEFFEVPSSSFGSIGGMSQGDNFDWYRQDRRPGQLNLNLILDEEVFYGLIDDPRINDTPIIDDVAPRQVTELSSINAAPAYQIYNRGFLRVWRTGTDGMGNPIYGVKNAKPLPNGNPDPTGQLAMSGAFSDFLKLRHGGSGYIFGNGVGSVGTNGVSAAVTHLDGSTTTVPPEIAEERYYRSLAFPDINYTVMRPASLPPSTETVVSLTANPALVVGDRYIPPPAPPAANAFVGDPGQMNPYIEWGNWLGALPPANPVPPIPPRRQFQIPDWFGQPGNPSAMTPTPATHHGSSERGNRNVNLAINHAPVIGTPYYTTPGVMLSNPFSNLFSNLFVGPFAGGANTLQFADPNDLQIMTYMAAYPQGNATIFPYDLNLMEYVRDGNATYFLGGAHLKNDTTKADYDPTGYVRGDDPDYDGVIAEASYDDPNRGGGAGTDNNVTDRRRHPYYRNELLQKVMNQTTVRTHQYAVWVTVGFFEVTEEGDSKYLKPDVIGPELVASGGDPVRYRSFFVVDRTKAVGFNPVNPGDFRDCVVYRRKID